MKKQHGFTLVELLVTIGIIVLLIGILMPVISKARAAGQRVACRAQLADIGRSFTMYLNESRNRIPRVNPTPSDPSVVLGAPSIVEVLLPYNKSTEVWHCPADRMLEPTAATTFETYFEQETTSYLYSPFINAAAPTDTWTARLGEYKKRGIMSSQVKILYDFRPFHAKKGTAGSTNCLFGDMHVEDLGS